MVGNLPSTRNHRAELYGWKSSPRQWVGFCSRLILIPCHLVEILFIFWLVELWQLFPLFYNSVMGQEHHHSGSPVNTLLLPRYCILRHNEQRVVFQCNLILRNESRFISKYSPAETISETWELKQCAPIKQCILWSNHAITQLSKLSFFCWSKSKIQVTAPHEKQKRRSQPNFGSFGSNLLPLFSPIVL